MRRQQFSAISASFVLVSSASLHRKLQALYVSKTEGERCKRLSLFFFFVFFSFSFSPFFFFYMFSCTYPSPALQYLACRGRFWCHRWEEMGSDTSDQCFGAKGLARPEAQAPYVATKSFKQASHGQHPSWLLCSPPSTSYNTSKRGASPDLDRVALARNRCSRTEGACSLPWTLR